MADRLTGDFVRKLYLTYVRPTAEYAAPVWESSLSAAQRATLERLQTRVARTVMQLDRCNALAHQTSPSRHYLDSWGGQLVYPGAGISPAFWNSSIWSPPNQNFLKQQDTAQRVVAAGNSHSLCHGWGKQLAFTLPRVGKATRIHSATGGKTRQEEVISLPRRYRLECLARRPESNSLTVPVS